MLVSISAITLVSPEELGEGETPLLKVVQAGAPNFPLGIFGFITMFAVANSALINMLMASRLVYGMSREHVLPAVLGKVHRDPAHALHRDRLHDAAGLRADHLRRRGAGARRHDRAAAAVRVHGGQRRRAGAAQGSRSTTSISARRRSCRCSARCPAPSWSGPWTGRDPVQYTIAAVLIGIGVVLWVVTVMINRATGQKAAEPTAGTVGGSGPVN